jgi:hypothetical protein
MANKKPILIRRLAAYELRLKVTEGMRTFDFSVQSNPDCELIGGVHYEGKGYNACVIPVLTARVSSRQNRGEF